MEFGRRLWEGVRGGWEGQILVMVFTYPSPRLASSSPNLSLSSSSFFFFFFLSLTKSLVPSSIYLPRNK